MKKTITLFLLLFCSLVAVVGQETTEIDLKDYSNGYAITSDGTYTITGHSDQGGIIVSRDITANITLKEVFISAGAEDACAFLIEEGAKVNLTLEGKNTLSCGMTCAGLQVSDGATLVIGGAGSLRATGGEGGYCIALTIPEGAGLTITNTATLTNNGTIKVEGGLKGKQVEGTGNPVTSASSTVTCGHWYCRRK